MSVTASFQPERISAAPGDTVALTLTLQNESDAECMVKLGAAGGLAAQTVLQTETIYLDPNEHFEVPVIVDANANLPAGMHSCVIEIDHDGDSSNAAATVEILEAASFAARLEPPQSKSASAGRHKVAIENNGNVPLMVEIEVSAPDELTAELAAPAINVDPGKTAKVELRLAPRARFWSGAVHEHAFTVDVNGSNGEHADLEGMYQQGPRVRSWFGPAAAGMVGALVVSALAWQFVLKPQVESIAREEAAELDEIQSADLQTQVDEIEAAAAEAAELPLGEPVDLRLDVTAGAASSQTTAFVFDENGSGRVLSITDIILQNPSGAVGTVELLRDDQVLQGSNMANFRDLDFHLVAPYRVDSRSEISLRVECETPGPGTESCEVAATILGFVDDDS
jgi:hypothetical protein